MIFTPYIMTPAVSEKIMMCSSPTYFGSHTASHFTQNQCLRIFNIFLVLKSTLFYYNVSSSKIV